MLRSIAMFIAGAVLVAGTFWNIWKFNLSVEELLPRSSDVIVVWENRFQGIRDSLIREGYTRGNLAYITPSGLARTKEERIHWIQLRYAAIPWILVRYTLDADFVIGDFTLQPARNIPAELVKIYDDGNGLILFKRSLPK